MADAGGRRRIVRSAAVAAVALLGFIGPVGSATATADDSGSSTVLTLPARWTVDVKCPVERLSDGAIVDVVYGTGTGSTHNSAKKNALKDANDQIPRGHRAHHCREI
ncbi:hypothetical protein ACWCQW_09140 [Streptomyces mirabilis]